MARRSAKKYMRTVSSLINVKDKINNIFRVMSHESKNIYNVSIFHTNFFLRYQNDIFKELYVMVRRKEIIDIEKFEEIFEEIYYKYYQRFSKIKSILHSNNQIIYKYIKEYIDTTKTIVTNDNFNNIKKIIINRINKAGIITVSKEDEKELYLDIVTNILKSMYRSSFNFIKGKIARHLPCDKYDQNFVAQVLSNTYLIFEEPINYKKLLMEHPIFKKEKDNEEDEDEDNEEEEEKETIKSNQYYTACMIRSYYKNSKLPSDVTWNIIRKTYKNFNSYFSLIEKGIKAKKPGYLDTNGYFILPFYERSCKLVTVNNLQYYRLTVGEYIANNYSDVINNPKCVFLNEGAKRTQKYVDESYLKEKIDGQKIFKGKNFITGNKYIEKDCNKIIDTYYVYVRKPDVFEDEQLSLIEISPLYDGARFKINFSYDKPLSDNQPIEGNMASFDMGQKNLVAGYDPNGEQIIIKGTHIKNINDHFQKKIDECKSKLSKYNSNNRKKARKNKKKPKKSQEEMESNISKGHTTKMNSAMDYMTGDKKHPPVRKKCASHFFRAG